MSFVFANGHAIPSTEQDQHLPYEWCDCAPNPIVQGDGSVVWQHNQLQYDPEALLAQAEAIRKATSVDLWGKAELAGHKQLKVIPFADLNPIHMPRAGERQ